MPINAAEQLNAIHSMLTAGNRNLRMEQHSLWLWGMASGLLFALSDHILTQAQIPDTPTRAAGWLMLLVLVFGGVAIMDWYLTKKAKAARDEVWSFIHRQIMKIWWLLVVIGSLLTFAMFFFGGGYMVCAAWIVLIGLGLFIHGLFSDEMLEWAGGAMLIIGILSLSFNFPYQTMKWIAASIFTIGLPTLSLLINRPQPAWIKLSQLLGWMLLVLLPPLVFQRYFIATPPAAEIITLADFRTQQAVPKTQIVALPENTTIPVHIQVTGDVFQPTPDLTLLLKLAKSVEIVMKDGKPTRQVRVSGNSWQSSAEAGWVNIPWIQAELSPAIAPQIKTELVVNLQHP